MKAIPKENAVIAPLSDEEKVIETSNLLNEIYNGITMLKKLESANLRSKLLKEIRNFNDLLFEFENNAYNSEEKEDSRQKIIRNLQNSSSFTAFKRWIIRDNSYFYKEFKDFLADSE